MGYLLNPNPAREGIYPADIEPVGLPELRSIEDEMSLLGAVLIDSSLIPQVNLEIDDFFDLRHKLIWRAINKLYAEDGRVDISVITEQLRRSNNLEEAGGIGYLSQLTISTSFNTVGSVRIIKDYSLRRKLLQLYQDGARSAINPINDIDLDWLIHRLSRLKDKLDNGKSSRYSTWGDLDNMIGPISWDWPDWLAKGFLNILVGMTGEGKSLLSLRICGCYLLGWPWPDGTPFTAEMGKVVWCEAEAAQALNLERAKKWGLPIENLLNPLEDPLADFRLTNQEHRDKLAGMIMRPDVVFSVVDSLSGADPTAEKSTEDTGNINWLAALARDAAKPIQLTHHLRKRSIFDTEGVVTLDRVRGISTILQYSRLIWALDTPDKTNHENKRLSVIKSNLGKKPEPIGVMIDDGGVVFGPAPELPQVETVTSKASDLLLVLLQKQPMHATQIEAEMKNAGISWAAARRAKDKLRIVSIKKNDGCWYWSLPSKEEDHENWTNH
jgi:hypothetical protein